MSWICCQIGPREHYAIPRALHQKRLLTHLYTDLWIPPGWLLERFSYRLAGSFHQDLENALVSSYNLAACTFALRLRFGGLSKWELFSKRNLWFQQRVVSDLARKQPAFQPDGIRLFAYSYAARDIVTFGRKQGWRTVLGQIDAGPAEDRIVQRLQQEYSEFHVDGALPPAEYWDRWRQECAAADQIVVNSSWSKESLVLEGVPQQKIHVIPLALKQTREASCFERTYPTAFTKERPLRVLFLGSIMLRKGVAPMLAAADLLRGEPIEFRLAGPVQVRIPERFRQHPQVKWLGPVARGQTGIHYRAADVFLLPSFSDGFGLTQLEAQSWQLPVVASRYCGEVVRDGVNGVLLQEVSAQAIAQTVLAFVRRPQALRAMAAQSFVDSAFSFESVRDGLLKL